MSLHINKFVDRIKAQESRGQRDFIMSMNEARDLHADITKLLLVLQHHHEHAQKSQNSETIEVVVTGGTF
jgi:hypothetical protein